MEEERRIAVLSVIVEKRVPAAEQVSVICIVLDAPASAINALTGKLGKLEGVSAKTLFSKY